MSAISPLHRTILLALLTAAALAAAASASPAATLVTCSGQQTSTYQPGITTTSRQTTVAGSETFDCASATHPSLAAATVTFSAVREYSCLSLLDGGPIARTIAWSTGAGSTLTGTSAVQIVDGQLVVVVTGTITAGLLRGASAVEQITLVGALDACDDTAGVSELEGPALLSVASL